jgi:ribosomal protein S12 methylthiotransferase accessory factor
MHMTIDSTLGTLPDLLDAEAGIITRIEFYKPRLNDPQFVHCHANITDTQFLAGGLKIPGTGGTALTEDAALAKAIGESVERYCGEFYDPESIIVAPARKLKERCIRPVRFILFDRSQYQPGFPFSCVSDDDLLGWVQGLSLTSGQHVLVPAVLVHLSYCPTHVEPLFDMGPVSGYACGATFDEAVLSAICEIVERDAFMVFWYNWLAVPSFNLYAAESAVVRSALQRYHPAPVRVFCADITTDTGIPAIVAVMVSREPGWPAAVVASAAHLDTEQAIAKALFELAANHLYIRSYYEQPAYHRLPRLPAEVVEMQDHGLFYCSPERLPYLEVLTKPWRVIAPARRPSLSSGDVKRDVDTCVQRLAAVGLEIIVVDLTTPDVESLGFKVVKVLIPGMQPIDFGPRRHLGGPRLYQVPAKLGYNPASGPHELNLFPHPFP